MERVVTVRSTCIVLVSRADADKVKIGGLVHKGDSVWKVVAADVSLGAPPSLAGLALRKIQGWDEALVEGVMLTLL